MTKIHPSSSLQKGVSDMNTETLIASIWMREYRRLKNSKYYKNLVSCKPSSPAEIIISKKQLNYLRYLVSQETPESGWDRCEGWRYNGRCISFGEMKKPGDINGKTRVMIPDVGYKTGEYGFLKICKNWTKAEGG